MIVTVFRVVIRANSRCCRLAILASQRDGHHCQWDYRAARSKAALQKRGINVFMYVGEAVKGLRWRTRAADRPIPAPYAEANLPVR